MSNIALTPNASGTGVFTIASPNSNTNRTLTLPDATGTVNISGLANEVPAGSAAAPAIYSTGDTNTGIFFPAADTIAFAEGGAEAMRIDASGNLLVATTSTLTANRRLQVDGGALIACVFKNSASANEVIDVWNSATSGNNVFVEWQTDAGTARGSVSYNRAGGLVTYNTTSDYRAKDIAGAIFGASNTVLNLKPYMGTMKGATIERPMLIAHETQEIAPYAVVGEKDAVDNEGNPIYQQMDHSALVPLLTAALQEALTSIQELTARITALEAAQ
jgi:hypothetical protein